MATEKPAVVFIGGGWHTPATYGKLVKALESAGHEVHCPHHPSLKQKLVESGRRVVAVMHSYGGQVGTNALTGLGFDSRSKDGKSGGGSMAGKVKDMGHEALMPIAFDFADDMTVLCRDPRGQLVGADADEAELESYVSTLVRWNGQSMYDAISKCAWREIPVTYVYTSSDMTVPLDYQKSMVSLLEEQGREVKTFELATGHCPNLTATDELVNIIGKVVG
ncbi:hypothetical protein B0I35DRAFT_517527 [Stachybotrys elegans]|uniref:AB hydrolase-1 domain-containing protein n=1 Tax=Stachybotrys elegans TaxID=80388 RepID=A0A8K0WJ52_9HYPO|nr:hypothetical protein B0I35DRAFT_517527 [Stachybotrys elegans]